MSPNAHYALSVPDFTIERKTQGGTRTLAKVAEPEPHVLRSHGHARDEAVQPGRELVAAAALQVGSPESRHVAYEGGGVPAGRGRADVAGAALPVPPPRHVAGAEWS